MGESVLKNKSFAFAVKIVSLCDGLEQTKQYALRDQILRSGTSIGANVREGRNAQGYKDMLSKFSIALKEADETQYWLDLLKETNKIAEEQYKTLTNDLNEIISMLVASVKTLKTKIEK